MTQRISTRRLLELMQQLQELANERAALEACIAETFQTETEATQQEHAATRQRLHESYVQERRTLENDFAQSKQTASQQWQQSKGTVEQEYAALCQQTESEHSQAVQTVERKAKESQWQTLAVFDAAKDLPQQQREETVKRLKIRRGQLDGLERDANTLLAMRRLTQAAQSLDSVEPTLPETASENLSAEEKISAEEHFQAAINQTHQAVLDFQSQRIAPLLNEGVRPLGWWLLACLLALLPVGWLAGWSVWPWILGTPLVGTVLTGILYGLLWPRGRRQSLDQFTQIRSLLSQAQALEALAHKEAKLQCQQQTDATVLRRDEEVAAAQQMSESATAKLDGQKANNLEQARANLEDRVTKLTLRRDQALAQADAEFPPKLDALVERRATETTENDEQHEHRLRTAQQIHDDSWAKMAADWKNGFQSITAELATIRATCDRWFPDWSATDWDSWQRPDQPPPAFRFGRCRLPLANVKNGVPTDPRLAVEQTHLELPALMTLDELPRLVISASGEGRAKATEVLQQTMLSFLTAMPAGKMRFTLIDPVGLGESFSAFMHLSDVDSQLVGKRIWTDSKQIEERLNLLSDHMEKVLQKYLRNEFETIHEYNQQAGEVAEPYHVLVMANFPAGLSDAAIRKLITIAHAGPRCGVYVLLSVDDRLRLPTEFDLNELTKDAVHLVWEADRLAWRYPLFQKLPLELDALPSGERLNQILRAAGQESHEASRVEVPFATIAPKEDQIWTGSTADELVVPIGRAGANELQSLRLGRGTAQHALISGKTGSGKSTLLHALVTNLALRYSPDEVEFYLIDFKKGVEFKAYATGQLPHARVIAIESEREFGISVLQRLDEELRRRGELFRKLGVQDVAGFRTAAANEPLPRILLVIDEFQELFVADDRLAQDAALLLDRLVRQGRAFGIHVLLGSQTLAGSYSLARSTIGQMAVRVALACSEADAHLILSDDNSAARLLSRPGEAIYNDQNGLEAGNSSFQVAWLPDAERQQRLAQILQYDRLQREATGAPPPEPPIVFEGNVPANPSDNEALSDVVLGTGNVNIAEPTVWLGAAVRIEPPTQLTLRRQGGNHLLMVGGEEPLALGMMANSILALVAQQRGLGVEVTVLDGMRSESELQGRWPTFAETLDTKNVRVASLSEVTSVITELADEVARRTLTPDQSFAPRYLLLHDLAQFRDLRLTEEDFSFSSNNKPPSLDKRFRDVLREGPAVGVHLLIWCDSHNSLSRSIDRLTMREIDYRVALQMSAADSTNLIDSPAASQLGENRAILYRDDLGSHVKFRPYGPPAAEWIAWVREQLAKEQAREQPLA